MTAHPSVWVASVCLSLASSIYSFSFETWMVVEHEKVRVRFLPVHKMLIHVIY